MFVCVEVDQKDFRRLFFQARKTETLVGEKNVFVPKGHLHFPEEGFLNCGIWVGSDGEENVLRTRTIRDNTAPCWTKENIHVDVKYGFFYGFFFLLFLSRMIDLFCFCLRARLAMIHK